jgi:hypothetical protein
MKIVLQPHVAIGLEAAVSATHGLEFSGFGWARIEGDELVVYDYVILDIGSSGYTEFGPEQIIPLLERDDHADMKLWFHRHPVGDGIPGPHNWSGRDNQTILFEPLGSTPEMVKWSASIVRTPRGWVGRIDRYLPEMRTVHVDVEPGIPQEQFDLLHAMLSAKMASRLPLVGAYQNEGNGNGFRPSGIRWNEPEDWDAIWDAFDENWDDEDEDFTEDDIYTDPRISIEY